MVTTKVCENLKFHLSWLWLDLLRSNFTETIPSMSISGVAIFTISKMPAVAMEMDRGATSAIARNGNSSSYSYYVTPDESRATYCFSFVSLLLFHTFCPALFSEMAGPFLMTLHRYHDSNLNRCHQYLHISKWPPFPW